MTTNNSVFRNRFRLSKVTPALVILWALFVSLSVCAQEAQIITINAPGADTKPGGQQRDLLQWNQ